MQKQIIEVDENGALKATNLILPALEEKYIGKVRDVYFTEHFVIMITTDRISAFDVVLPKGIPYKGQILNQMANKGLQETNEVVPNWVICNPHPMVTIGKKCTPFPVEIIVRATNTGSCWKNYKTGKRQKSGVQLPEGMVEDQLFPEAIITPTTKAEQGNHDEDISYNEIIAKGLATKEELDCMYVYAKTLFKVGSEKAKEKGLLLADTKYEFGKDIQGNIVVIDEVHTPDSSRYFYLDDYAKTVGTGKTKQLSKEFVRKWLEENGFTGEEGQKVPEMTKGKINEISARYTELLEKITGDTFIPVDNSPQIIDAAIKKALIELGELS